MQNAESPGQQEQYHQPPPSTATAAEAGEPPVNRDRRLSDEWDAAKVPPSRFQKRKGSIYATPSSRDGHVDKNKVEKYFAKIAEMKGSK
ncbi:hypothetical protein MKX07_008736 [Trichoderma sp. CBMAI-0711]|uniref:Uncharacterized protein n=2 Tax=Trichoderma TaxID=5543 RepID=A0A2H2ZPS0_TRIPA|nr:hypothetical protein MKX07_008736 [Trichoderma sp. CBMAI-0711]OTA02715.1 hypothetical protein A9Z42_0031720 [Trichoderma parareesei]